MKVLRPVKGSVWVVPSDGSTSEPCFLSLMTGSGNPWTVHVIDEFSDWRKQLKGLESISGLENGTIGME